MGTRRTLAASVADYRSIRSRGMTTKDNQNFRISISMTTQTPAGIDWKGEVEVSGPYDDAMLDQVVALSDQLAEKAMEQRAISSRLTEALDAIESLPARPRKKRSKLDQVMDAGAQVIKDAEAVENQAAAQVDELDSMADELNLDVVSQLVKEGEGLMASALEHQKAEVGSMQTLGKPHSIDELAAIGSTVPDDDDDDLPF